MPTLNGSEARSKYRQAAVQRHRVAGIDGDVDGRGRPLAGRLDEILLGRLASPGRLETAVPQQVAYGGANLVAALHWRRGV